MGNAEQDAEIVRLRQAGVGVVEIRKLLRINNNTLTERLKALGLTRPKRAPFDSLMPWPQVFRLSDEALVKLYAGQRYEDDPYADRYGRLVMIDTRRIAPPRQPSSNMGCAGAMCAGEN